MLFALFKINKSQRDRISNGKSPQTEPYRAPSRLERMHANPDVNTRNWEIHVKRMNKYGRSKFNGDHYTQGQEAAGITSTPWVVRPIAEQHKSRDAKSDANLPPVLAGLAVSW